MFSNILIPTDGSRLAGVAVEKGIALAKENGAKVTVLTVTEPFHIFSAEASQIGHVREEFESYTHERGEHLLNEVREMARVQGVACESLQLEHEYPHQAIVDTASQRHCDLICISSHGRGEMKSLLLGGVTFKVLTYSRLPVLVYR